MRWEDFRQSENIEDRREEGGDGGGGFRLPIGGGGISLGGLVVLGVISYALGINPLTLIGLVENGAPPQQQQTWVPKDRPTGTPHDRQGQFVAAVLAQTEDVWSQVLPAQTGKSYRAPRLVLFRGATESACGAAQSAMGPFYCPNDRKVYLDLAFFDEMRTRFGGGGDFADAYVIAHEVGHHVQNLLGILPEVHQLQQQSGDRRQANALSVRLELQADCLAGVWAANAEQRWRVLESGDVERAIATAQAIGDDRLQRASRGTVVPDSFTHGSSEQRVRWLKTGLQGGKVEACDTFGAGRR